MKKELKLIRMSDIQPEEVNWLWYPLRETHYHSGRFG